MSFEKILEFCGKMFVIMSRASTFVRFWPSYRYGGRFLYVQTVHTRTFLQFFGKVVALIMSKVVLKHASYPIDEKRGPSGE